MRSFVIAAVMTALVAGAGFALAPARREPAQVTRPGAAADGLSGRATGEAGALAGTNIEGATPASAAAPAAAASSKRTFFQWTDARGSVRFARSRDEVPAEWRERAGQVEVDTSAYQPRPPRPLSHNAGRNRPAQEQAALRRADLHDVTVYTAPWCGWCRKTLAFLDQRGVDYVNKDIEADADYASELVEKSGGHSVPFVEIDGAQIHGYNPSKMAALLE